MILFWVAFGGFFFGLTYGLLQICTEFAVLRRERFAGLRAGPYVLAKAAVLLPLLAVVDAVFLVVLRALGRLPGAGDYGAVFAILVLSSAAALGLGLLISAAVSTGSGHDRDADGVLPAGAVRRGDPAGAGDGRGRPVDQLRDVEPVGVRGTRP